MPFKKKIIKLHSKIIYIYYFNTIIKKNIYIKTTQKKKNQKKK